ncbi:MAG TPA: radical SAM protein [Actinobacteria bacterium]|nr:radical SAM protein [Actinomycetota bacterium]
MARTPDGPPPPPTVQRVRIRYAKRGRLRFTSHRDFQRSFERALRRAQVPVAFSAGFSPHPRVSYANAAPTAVASEAEYLEVGLSRVCELRALHDALDASLPTGFDIIEVVAAGSGSLADRLEASLWRIELPGISRPDTRAAVGSFLGLSEVPVERMTKNGIRRFDAREAVVSLAVLPDDGPTESASPEERRDCAILQLVVRHTTPAVRPDDVLTGLRTTSGLAPFEPPRVTRLAQGPLDPRSATIGDPFDPDRSASADTITPRG